MSASLAALIFVGSLALSVVSSTVLAELLDRIGTRFRLPEGLVGIVTALGADSPEIAAAVTAITAGSRDLGIGIVLGSNLYNIAALLGLSAAVAGAVRIRRRAPLVQGTVAVAVTATGVALVLEGIRPVASLILVIVILTPYLVGSSLNAARLQVLLPDGRFRRFLLAALIDQEKDVRSGKPAPAATRTDLMAVTPVLVAVVLASVGMVHAARSLGHRWAIPDTITGTLVLAVLTGIPNLLASIRLAGAVGDRRSSARG